jgi:hypothetical protein
MKVSLGTVEVTERERRALSIFRGEGVHMADRDTVREFLLKHGTEQLDRLAWLPEYAARLNEARGSS